MMTCNRIGECWYFGSGVQRIARASGFAVAAVAGQNPDRPTTLWTVFFVPLPNDGCPLVRAVVTAC